MHIFQPLDHLPLWAVLFLTLGIVLLGVELGFFLGTTRRLSSKPEVEKPIGTMVGAVLGLLAFMLAFTFGMAASRYDDRKQLVLDEANAIGTTYLRAALLPDPARVEFQRLLREYTTVRASSIQINEIEQGIGESERLHRRLWDQVRAVSASNSGRAVDRLLIQSVNEVIDLHTKRVVAATHHRIPGIVWMALYFLALIGMILLGYQFGLVGMRSTIPQIALVLAFSVVMFLVVDLDRPRDGLLTVSQQVMIDLHQKLNGSQAPRAELSTQR